MAQSHIYSERTSTWFAGEQRRRAGRVLKRLSQHYERFAEVQQKFVSALIYPAVVTCVGIGIIIFFMTYMLPKFISIFEDMNVPLRNDAIPERDQQDGQHILVADPPGAAGVGGALQTASSFGNWLKGHR